MSEICSVCKGSGKQVIQGAEYKIVNGKMIEIPFPDVEIDCVWCDRGRFDKRGSAGFDRCAKTGEG